MLKNVFFILAGLIGVSALGFIIWASNPLGPEEYAADFLNKNDSVSIVYEGSDIVFVPEKYDKALIFYPGGRVDYRSYSPYLYNLASRGIMTVLVKMPLSLAVFDSDAAGKIVKNHTEIKEWFIGGHSLGGAMASKYIFDNPGQITGLVLLASYPAGSNDISKYDINVLSIHAENDGLATPEKIESFKYLLPDNTEYFMIKGGNHAQFGYYGEQSGDGDATVSKDFQQKEILDKTYEFIKNN
ncbi:MAG TPA: alpha/beta hydrolase [Tepiditoga sp.]|nr:alpha/beta hydrolase [Thermotogota bacterium]HOO74274.1 alpha/beta hydrolase [Tepiditoga sp.]